MEKADSGLGEGWGGTSESDMGGELSLQRMKSLGVKSLQAPWEFIECQTDFAIDWDCPLEPENFVFEKHWRVHENIKQNSMQNMYLQKIASQLEGQD